MGRRWTNEDVDRLKHLAQAQPTPKIAEILDRTVGGVVFKAHTLGLSLKPRERMSGGEEGQERRTSVAQEL
jgi:hypothetical protein